MKMDLDLCFRNFHITFMQQSFKKSIKMNMFGVKSTLGCMKQLLKALNELVVVYVYVYMYEHEKKNI